MIDYIKIRIGLNEYDLSTVFKGTKGILECDTSELTSFTKKLGGLVVRYNKSNSTLDVHGSIHKFYKGGHNHERFTFSEFEAAILKLSKALDICYDYLLDADLTRFEFGVNLTTDLEPSVYLNAFKSFKRIRRKEVDKLTRNFILRAVNDSVFKVKMYDKGRQHNISYAASMAGNASAGEAGAGTGTAGAGKARKNILRFELVREYRCLSLKQISKLGDLLLPSTFTHLSGILKEYFQYCEFANETRVKTNARLTNKELLLKLILDHKTPQEVRELLRRNGMKPKTLENTITTLNKLQNKLEPVSLKEILFRQLKAEISQINDF